jgi:hypothetical protein
MTVYTIREGKLVEVGTLAEARADKRSIFPAPMVSRMAPFESPVTGKEITSWRERDADMKAVGAVDPRDFGKHHEFKRGRAAQAEEAKRATGNSDPFWRDRPA